MKKFFFFIAASIASMVIFAACTKTSSDNTVEKTVAPLPDSVVVEVLKNDSLLRPDSKVERLTVIDFSATWCGPCQVLAPSFHAVADSLHGMVDFYSVDVDEMSNTAEAFSISSIPCVVIMSPNVETRTYIGLDPFLEGINIDGVKDLEELSSYVTEGLYKVIGEK